jgi:putative colanic acid biosynthesis UDP-glucose lipid carrier transferase
VKSGNQLKLPTMGSALDPAIRRQIPSLATPNQRVRFRRTPDVLDQRVALGILALRLLDPVATVTVLVFGAWWLGLDFTVVERVCAAVGVLLVIGLFRNVAEGQPWRRSGWRAMASALLGSWLMVAGTLVIVGAITGIDRLCSPTLTAVWLLVTPLLMLVYHSLVRILLLVYVRRRRRTAVAVAFSAYSLSLRRALQDADEVGVDFVGFFDDRGRARLDMPGSEVLLGTLTDAVDYVRRHRIDLVYITLPLRGDARIAALLDGLSDSTTSVFFVPDLDVVDLLQGRIDQIGGIPVLGIWETPYYGVNAIVKRVADIFMASLAVTLLAPVLLAIAVAVKLTSPGPILFKQRRYGFGGEEIIVYKFRTMTVCEDGAQVTQASRNDPRITPLGQVLRRLSLDELPQFVNVLQGRMSIVGPRPHAIAHNEHYRQLISGYMHRHKIKPGITGWAQVNGLRGETDTVDKMRARVAYDLEYLRNWSIWLDIRIVLRTARLIFQDANAY